MKGRITMLITSIFVRGYMSFSSILTFSFFRFKKAKQKLVVIRQTRRSITAAGNVTIPRNRIIPLNKQQKLHVLESSKAN